MLKNIFTLFVLFLAADVHAIVNDEIHYPLRAWQLNKVGYVTMCYNINDAGRAENIRVIASEPEGFFERTSVNFLKNKRFDKHKPEYNKLLTIKFEKTEDTIRSNVK